MRDATFSALVHAPLLAADDLSLVCGIGERGASRALDALVSRGEAGYVTDPTSRRHLYYLTADGVAVAAPLAGMSPQEVTGRYGLGERAVRRRLPALRRLIAGRRFLLELAAALPCWGGTLEAWQAFPVRWPYRCVGGSDALILDGEATLRFADGVSCVVGYLWDDDPDAPPDALAARLDQLAAARACPDYAPPSRTRVPPVLLVTTSAARIPVGYRPGLLWTTVASLDAAGPSGPLAVRWASAARADGQGTEGQRTNDLRAALDRLGVMAPRPTPGSARRAVMQGTAPAGPDDLRRRAVVVRAAPPTMPARGDVLALPLALPPRAWPLLLHVGQHPLLDRRALATITGSYPFDTWDVLRSLCRYGLCQVWRPNSPGHGRAWRYSLTARGTSLLAQGAGLAPVTYRRVHGVLDDARSSGERGLTYARGNLAHTDGVNAAFLAFFAAARTHGGNLWWRGEWACTRPYLAPDRHGRERTHTLRPDAEVRYDGPGGPFRAFVEIDLDSESAQQLAGKVEQYDAYRAWSGDDGFSVLFVTPGPKRGEGPLTRAREIARDRRRPPLDVRATTATALSASGPWGPIWRDAHGAIRPFGS